MKTDPSSNDDKANGESKGKESGGSSKRKDICRDYLNNICNRGSRCKFYHPPEEHATEKAQNAADEPYQFCIDFQNQGCHRDNCRYVHACREDVERYKRSGDVTLGLARALAALLKGDQINGIPLCKEFQNGRCARGTQCRYWHINRDEERRKRFSGRPCGGGASPTALAAAFGAYAAVPPPHESMMGGGRAGGSRRGGGSRMDDFTLDDYTPAPKRPYPQAFAPPPVFASVVAPPPAAMAMPQAPPVAGAAGGYHSVVELERRNAELTTEVEGLRRELQREKERYDDLMALFRATQGQPIQQQAQPRVSSLLVGTSPSPSNAAQQQTPGMQSLVNASLQQQQQQQQQPGLQQWGNSVAAATAGVPTNWAKVAYDWSTN